MITCATVLDALKVPNVIHVHVETDNSVTAYQQGDTLAAGIYPKPHPKQNVLDEIAELEASMTSRMLREAALGDTGGKARLQALDAKIAALRATLK